MPILLTNKAGIPLPLAIWLAGDSYAYANEPNVISATTLMRSTRYIIATLRLRFPEAFPEEVRLTESLTNIFVEDLIDRIPSRMGTYIHDACHDAIVNDYANSLSKLGYPNQVINRVKINPSSEELLNDTVAIYTEQRTNKEIDGFIISGQFDAVINGRVHDIKTTGTYSYTSGSMDRKYTIQGSIYKWLNPEIITDDVITINFLFTNWNRYYTSKPDYPPARAYSKDFPIWSVQQTELYIQNKIREIKKYWNEPLENIPCCTNEDLFNKKPVYKYYKTGYVEGKRSTRNFDNYGDASLYRSKQGGIGEIIEDKGKPFTCPCCNIAPTNLFNVTPTMEIE